MKKSCNVCDRTLKITEIDAVEKVAWFSCPEYANGNDEHESFPILFPDDRDFKDIFEAEEHYQRKEVRE